MRHLTTTLLLLFTLALPLSAQTPEEDRGYLQGLIEDNLSGAGRDVRIIGFEGALSSNATIEELTVADEDGIWITLRGLTLTWSRSALLRGRLQVDELSAEEVLLPRLPRAQANDLPQPEATPFSLPELPVSIKIDRFAIERVVLGAPVIGIAAEISAEGSASLADGEGMASLSVERLDTAEGSLVFTGSYTNATRELALDLSLTEGSGGIVSTLLDLPDSPSIALTLEGAGPLDDFTADIALATDGTDRLTGAVNLTALAEGQDTGRAFDAQLSGDIRPLMQPEHRDFFGPELSLNVSGEQLGSGRLTLDTLDVTTQALSLNGQLALGADKWPERIDLLARVAAQDGAPVLLALPGVDARVSTVSLRIAYDAARSDQWTASFLLDQLSRDDIAVQRARIDGSGTLTRGTGSAIGQVQGAFDVAASGLAPADPALARALGEALTGRIALDWQQGSPLEIDRLALNGDGYGLDGTLSIGGLETDPSPDITGDLHVTASDIARFSGLAGRDLGGSIDLRVTGTTAPLDGTFDAQISGTARDIATGIPEADGLLGGQSTLSLDAARSQSGVVLRSFDLNAPGITASASGTLASSASQAVFDISLPDTSRIRPQLTGAARLTGTATQSGDTWRIETSSTGPGGAAFDGTATVRLIDGTLGPISGDGALSADDLAPYAAIAQRDLGGAIDITGEGRFDPRDQSFAAKLTGTITDLRVGIAQVDGLMAGDGDFTLDATRDATGIEVRTLRLNTPAITASADGALRDDGSAARFDISLAETSAVLPDLSGAATLRGTVDQTGDDWRVEATATGPGGAAIDAQAVIAYADGVLGQIRGQGQISADSLAPYAGLANRPLGGSITLSGSGSFDPADATFGANITGSGTDLRAGIAAVDQLTAGRSTVTLNTRRTADTTLIVDALDLNTPQITATADGQLGPDGGTLTYDVTLRDLGLFAPGFSGAASARGTATSGGGDYTVDAALTGPGGTNADVSGTIAPDASRADLSLTGAAPLALINGITAPNVLGGTARFDLRLNGAPSLNALSGRVTTADADLTLPGPALSLTGINADIGLSGGRAQLDLRSGVSSGGNIQVTGPITLSAPFNGDLAIGLRRVGIQDPGLVETQVNGDLTLRGALTRDAQLSGQLNFDAMEVRIPDTGMGAAGSDFVLTHVGEPAEVRRTRARAGLLASQNEGSGRGIAYPLDLAINAPSRIFVRGRGLDAELGGQLRLRGTTANVVPQGEFDLVRGRLDILGQRLALSQASISLQGNFDAFLRVVAETARNDVSIRFVIEGPVSSPDVTISSTPERPEEEVLALLLFGRDVTEISAFQALRIAAAVNTLVGRGGGGIVERLRMGFGLDDIDVQTGDDGTTQLRLGKYLTENIYTDVTVGASGETEINLNLQVTPQITARGTAGTDGDTGLGIFFEKDY